MVPKGRHFGRQNGAKIIPKMRFKFKNEKVASWKRFWMILGRFGSCLGLKNVVFSLVL